MSDNQQLLVVLAALYLADCLVWLHRGSVGIVSWLGRRWRVVYPGQLFGNASGGFIVAPPLPPLGTVLRAHFWPLSISPDGVCAYSSLTLSGIVRPPQAMTVVDFDRIDTVTSDGCALWVNGDVFVKCRAAGQARVLAALLESVRKAGYSERERLIAAAISVSLDLDGAAERLVSFRRYSASLRVATNALWCWLFVVAPLLVWHRGLEATALSILIGMGALALLVCLLLFLAHRDLFRGATADRLATLFKALVCPPFAIRALDMLATELYAEAHPLAVLAAVSRDGVFAEFARRLLLDLQYPLGVAQLAPSAAAIDAWFREKQVESLTAFLAAVGLSAASVTVPDWPAGEAFAAYCPRCHCQYIEVRAECADCQGVALKRAPRRNEGNQHVG